MMCFFGSKQHRFRNFCLKSYETKKSSALPGIADVTVCHFPPGTSKWNKIEHRMFSHITKNWRGRPLTSHEVIVNLIANTTTDKGLKIKAGLDDKEYPTEIKISDKELNSINLKRNDFHGEWNYTILFLQNQ